MSMSQRSRTAVYDGLSTIIPDRDALEELMSHFPARELDEPATKEFVAARSAELRTEMADLWTEMADLRAEMADLRTELKGEVAGLRTELHAAFRRQTLALVGLMVSMTATMTAAVTLSG
jgi:hypothetical protein